MFDRFLEIAHFHNDNDRRIAQFVFFVFLLAAAAVFGFGGAVHGVRRRSNDWAHAARNAVASKLVEANPGGLKPHIDMLARIAWLREPLRQHYEREWQSLLELCGLNPCRKAIPWTVEMEEQLARRLHAAFSPSIMAFDMTAG